MSEEHEERYSEIREKIGRDIANSLGIPYEDYVKDMGLTVAEFIKKYGLKEIKVEITPEPQFNETK